MNSKPVGATGNNGGGGVEDYILIRDEKANNVDGGSFSAGVWQTRDLTTIVKDAGGHASLNANQITLVAGTYRVRSQAPAYRINRHKTKLKNITDNVDIEIGSSEFCSTIAQAQTHSFLEGEFTINAPKLIELQHQAEALHATLGLGIASAFGIIEIYSVIEFWKRA